MHENALNTEGSESDLLQGDKHHTPPSGRPSLHLSTGHTVHIYNKQEAAERVKKIQRWRKDKVKRLTWFLPFDALIEAVTLVREDDKVG